jgi:long-chain acyl-CoA synthetase
MTSESVVLVAMPLFHIGGSGRATVAHFVGARLEILRELDLGELICLFSTSGVTHAFVVPTVLQFLLFGCKFFQVYGLTETTGAITHLPPSDHDLAGPNRHRLRSCGVPGPGVELRIVDVATGADISDPEVPGEICVRGQQVMKGYWNNPEATRMAIADVAVMVYPATNGARAHWLSSCSSRLPRSARPTSSPSPGNGWRASSARPPSSSPTPSPAIRAARS